MLVDLRIILKFLSYIYGFFAVLRRLIYEKGLIKKKKLPVYTISVGNLSVGGTGKTPFTIYLSKLVKDKNKKVVVLSRGYKRKSKEKIIICDNDKTFSDCGDEPYLIFKNGINVVVSSDRYKAGLKAKNIFNPDIFILDDGFQHFQLYRDLNILMVDATKPFWKDNLLPYGRLREPASFYKYADIIIITKTQALQEDKLKDLEGYLKSLNKPYFFAKERFSHVVDKDSNIYDFSFFKDKKVIAFAGLGNNKQFFEIVKKYFNVEKFIEFPDHFDYRDYKFEKDKIYITTEKDLIKINQKNIFAIKYEIFCDKEFEELINGFID